MSRALVLSPHLDDVAFSCGGLVAALAGSGWDCHVVTCFTLTVPHPQGFALECQTDKGLAPDVDYMALRRAEDEAAMGVLGATHEHLDLPEAPHRGYDSPAHLFAGTHADDDVDEALAERLRGRSADLVLLPQGIGGHVDHLQVRRAAEAAGLLAGAWAYADLPYALRLPRIPGGPGPAAPDLARKLDACAAYTTQLGFQFGGEAAMRKALGTAEERFIPPTKETP